MDLQAWRDLTPATHIGEHSGCHVFQVEPDIYVMEMSGHLTNPVMYRCFELCWNAPDFRQPYTAVQIIGDDVSYDPELRNFTDMPNLIGSAAVAVVTDKTMGRVVLSTVGIVARLRHQTEVSAHAEFPDALNRVRAVLEKRGASAPAASV